jgi:DNA-directed RNA polymerase subunit delta
MNIKNMKLEELEKLSHLDIAYNMIKFSKEKYTTIELLKEICSILKYSEKQFEEMVGDFYTSLTLDKRFILIDNKWDLAENHQVKIVIEDDLDDEIEEYEDLDDEEDSVVEDDIIADEVEVFEEEDEIEDEIEDLSIVEEDEEAEDEI